VEEYDLIGLWWALVQLRIGVMKRYERNGLALRSTLVDAGQ